MRALSIKPAEGANVRMEIKTQVGFNFNQFSDKLLYLISDVNYNESDINTLIPLLNNIVPIQVQNPTSSNPTYFVNFNYSNPSDLKYLYLVWDLRTTGLESFCYDVTIPQDACCDCGSALLEFCYDATLSASACCDCVVQ